MAVLLVIWAIVGLGFGVLFANVENFVGPGNPSGGAAFAGFVSADGIETIEITGIGEGENASMDR